MEIRQIKESDFSMLDQWWLDHGMKIPDRKLLPHNGTGGFIVSIGKEDVAAGYLYFTNSSIAYSDFGISNANYRNKEKRNKAIAYLLDYVFSLALKKGYTFTWATSKVSGVINKCKELGYDINEGHTLIYKYK
jgi:hypothetical protein